MYLTFTNLCNRLNRAPVYVRGLQRRFTLPIPAGATYSASYACFLETIVHLRVLGIPEDTLVHLWTLERKLMQLLHADSTGSPTWFLDACGGTGNRDHRLLLSNFDIGTFLSPGAIQLGLDFADKKSTPELFSAPEMGEDAIAVLRQYLPLHQQILRDIRLEGPVLQAALRHYPPARQSPPEPRKPRPRNKPEGATLIPGEI